MLSILQTCSRFVRYDLNHIDAEPLTPYKYNLFIQISLSIVSKALHKSRNTTPFIKPESMLISHELVVLNNDVVVDWPFLKLVL